MPGGVSSIGDSAFYWCTGLTGVCFEGKAPGLGGKNVFYAYSATLYYLPTAVGWETTFGYLPTALWLPEVPTADGSFGIGTNGFSFQITWADKMVVAVEACTNFANPIWSPLLTNTLSSDTFYFSDPDWTNYPSRFYRVRSP